MYTEQIYIGENMNTRIYNRKNNFRNSFNTKNFYEDTKNLETTPVDGVDRVPELQ